jgi:hypothetical protein
VHFRTVHNNSICGLEFTSLIAHLHLSLILSFHNGGTCLILHSSHTQGRLSWWRAKILCSNSQPLSFIPSTLLFRTEKVDLKKTKPSQFRSRGFRRKVRILSGHDFNMLWECTASEVEATVCTSSATVGDWAASQQKIITWVWKSYIYIK